MHILSAEQFDRLQIEKIFKRADYFKRQNTPAKRRKLADLHKGRQICTVFFQPSTRTRLSFETAAAKMGMGVISTENAREHSSSVKGETIEDTIRILNQYGYDAVVMRHHEEGAAARAASVSQTPIINAGDGRSGEHPTQSLLDAYTIRQNFGRLDNLKIVMGGDLLQSRCVRSLAIMLSKYKNNHFVFLSVPEFQVGKDVKSFLKKAGVDFELTEDKARAFKDADVVYWTRLQREYMKNTSLKTTSPGDFIITRKTLSLLPKKSILMHPLPRVDEINPEVDNDPRAKYFEQAGNGLYVRMTLLDGILSKTL